SRVVLPAPLGPTTPSASPAPTVTDRSSTTLTPNDLVRCSTSSTAVPTRRPPYAIGWISPSTGTSGSWSLTLMASSSGYSSPPTHWPATSGVFDRLGTGPLLKSTGPTTVARSVAASASFRSSGSAPPARLRASIATSKRAWAKPSGWVHCDPVSSWKAAASSPAVCPVSDEVNGWRSVHQISLDRPSPAGNDSTALGNSSALPTVITGGSNPCCRAWLWKLAKVGGGSTPDTMATPSERNRLIWALKSCVSTGKRPG